MTTSPLGTIAMAPTSLYVEDLDRSLAWYRDVLGLEPMTVSETSHRFAVFALGSTILVLEPLATLPDDFAPTQPGSGAATVNLVIDGDAVSIRDELTARGVACSSLTRSEHHLTFLVHDPDGNRFYVAQAMNAGD